MDNTVRFRASQIGKLMKAGRSKSQSFGLTAKKSILTFALKNVHGWEENVYSKYMDKGINNEREAVKMLLKHKGWKPKNEEDVWAKRRRNNDWISGEADVFFETDKGEMILADVKCSYSPLTFPWLEEIVTNEDYIYQMQSYMWLYDMDVCYLAYCLTDTPEFTRNDIAVSRINREVSYPHNHDKSFHEIEDEVAIAINKEFTFKQFTKRVKVFELKRNEETIEEIKSRVEEARELYNQIIPKIK